MESIHVWDGRESAHTTSLKSKKIALWKRGELISLRLFHIQMMNLNSLTNMEDLELVVSKSLKRLPINLLNNKKGI